ncbi:MAG TPA: CoA-transferase [Streptosporangiaceae bacterium]|jgi:propionate CoA-transferase|nr:CoA-transferase [Streptosporangiaceae bacterium]
MRVCDAAEAAALVPDGATVLVEGSGGGVNEPAAILAALEQRFLDQQQPRDLTVVHISGMGDGHGGGIDRLAHAGIARRVIGGHWGWSQRMQRLAAENLIEAYCLPQGTLSHLMRDIAAGRPGAVSAVGLGTFVDPRHGGGRLNAAAREDLVELVTLAGREWLFTRAFPVDVAIIRGTEADADGNLVMDGEGLLAEALSAAQAARNSGGIVLAQARHLVAAGSLDPRRVRVPGILVDALVIDPGQRLSSATADDPYLTGRLRAPRAARAAVPLSVRKVIARRAALELYRGDVINLGYGMPDGVAAVLAEEGITDAVTLTVEQGHVGGIPAGGSDFGLCVNPVATLDAGHQFDWYDGGGLDAAVLSFAELDADGNVNVSQFGDRMPGVGGFINISQGARRLVFTGAFVAGRGAYQVGDGAIGLPPDGLPKLVKKVEQVSFASARARETGQDVCYVTERAVFRLTGDGPELTEIAPGLDVERDVLRCMGFTPRVSDRLTQMDERVFREEPMNLVLPSRKELR